MLNVYKIRKFFLVLTSQFLEVEAPHPKIELRISQKICGWTTCPITWFKQIKVK